MKIPANMTEQEILDTMEIVINRIAPRYTFYGYDVHDIKQESYIICMEAVDRYDGIRPLENFLSVNLSNRLKNFVRDNYFISDANNSRIKVLQPAQLEYEEYLVDDEEDFELENSIDLDHYVSFIDRFLPASMRMDYLKLINNIYLPKNKKQDVVDKIIEIIEEAGYEKG
jgi:DNA-directed RNA polymerase specialized sigma24 family protein